MKNSGSNAFDSGIMYTQGNIYQEDINADEDDFSNEPPLLEGISPIYNLVENIHTYLCAIELGIDFNHIWKKTLFTLNPTGQISEVLLDDADLTGPILFLFLFASLLLLVCSVSGLHSVVWQDSVRCCLRFRTFRLYSHVYPSSASVTPSYILLNLMSETKAIDISHVMSVLGYGLIPLLFVAFIKIFFSLKYVVDSTFDPLVIYSDSFSRLLL